MFEICIQTAIWINVVVSPRYITSSENSSLSAVSQFDFSIWNILSFIVYILWLENNENLVEVIFAMFPIMRLPNHFSSFTCRGGLCHQRVSLSLKECWNSPFLCPTSSRHPLPIWVGIVSCSDHHTKAPFSTSSYLLDSYQDPCFMIHKPPTLPSPQFQVRNHRDLLNRCLCSSWISASPSEVTHSERKRELLKPQSGSCNSHLTWSVFQCFCLVRVWPLKASPFFLISLLVG